MTNKDHKNQHMNEELRNELRGSILERVDKEDLLNPAPDGFFDSLAETVLSKVEKSSPVSGRIRFMNMNVIAAAAALLVLVGVFYICTLEISDKELFENAEREDLIEFAMNEVELEELEAEHFRDWEYSFSLSTLSTEEIGDYLENDLENIDLEYINEYL